MPELLEGMLKNPASQLIGELGLVADAQRYQRGDIAVDRVVPPQQGLGTQHLARSVDLGLKLQAQGLPLAPEGLPNSEARLRAVVPTSSLRASRL